MKSTQYLTYLKTILLIVPAAVYFSSPTIVHAGDRRSLSVGFVTPRHLEDRGELRQGQLMVYSATDRSDDGGLEYYAHSSYAIYTVDGELEHRGLEAYGPEALAMREAFGSPNGWNGMLEHYAAVAGR